MKKIVSVLIGVLSPVLGAVGTKLWLDRKTRREAAEARPKIEALLDEMIAVVAAHRGPLDDIVMCNSAKTVNDEKRDRDISIHAGGRHLSLDVSTSLIGRNAGQVSVRMYRSRGEQVLHVYWPAIAAYGPMEPWLKERLDRLDKLVGDVSRRSRIGKIISRFGGTDGDDGPPTTN